MKTARIALALLATGVALPSVARAEDPVADVKTAGFKLKNRSIFNQPEDARAPFWPIGWQKPAPGQVQVTQVEAPKVVLDPDQFSLTSIVLGPPSFAVINGKAYAEGEYIHAARAAKASSPAAGPATTGAASLPPGTKVRVARIRDGLVTLDLNGQLTEIQLRRHELPSASSHGLADEGADLLKPLSER